MGTKHAPRLHKKHRKEQTNKPQLNQKTDTPSSNNHIADMISVQNGNFDPEIMMRLQRTIGNQAIQRLISYKDYKKSTKAPGKRSHIRGLDKAYQLYLNNEPTMRNKQKIEKLQELIQLADIYLNDPKRQDSKRRDGVVSLKNELLAELNGLRSNLDGNEFTDENLSEDKGAFGSGMMGTVNLVEYGFGIMQEVDDEGVAHDVKVQDETFEGVFKPDDTLEEGSKSRGVFDKSRAVWTGIDAEDARLSQRSVATYELAKLFDPSIIPPTFLAQHEQDGQQVMGTVMEKVQGVEANKKLDPKTTAHMMFKEDPVYRQGVSKLMMFDFIAGQVDRHQGNYMIEMKDGVVTGVKGIDNDLSFGDQFTDLTYNKQGERDYGAVPEFAFNQIAGKRIQSLDGIDKTLAQRIIEVSQSPELVRNALDGLLSDSEIAATVSRLDSLAGFLQPLLENNDDIIVSEWS